MATTQKTLEKLLKGAEKAKTVSPDDIIEISDAIGDWFSGATDDIYNEYAAKRKRLDEQENEANLALVADHKDFDARLSLLQEKEVPIDPPEEEEVTIKEAVTKKKTVSKSNVAFKKAAAAKKAAARKAAAAAKRKK